MRSKRIWDRASRPIARPTGWNAGWAAEFGAQAQGVGRTFTHEFLGFGGTLAILSDLADREPLNPALAWRRGGVDRACGCSCRAACSIGWRAGGRCARRISSPRAASTSSASCGWPSSSAPRTGRCSDGCIRVCSARVYHRLHARHDARNATASSSARCSMSCSSSLVAIVNVVADFAKVRAVVEDRRSMLGAIGASLRFIRRRVVPRDRPVPAERDRVPRHPAAVAAGGAVGSRIRRGWRCCCREIYLLARVWAKLAFMASEIVFFQGELAHAQYTAAAGSNLARLTGGRKRSTT